MESTEITLNSTVIRDTPEYLKAVEITRQIKANASVACDAMVAVCQDLKKMRDERLYTAMGFQTFDEYVERAVGIKARQAYNYISTYERLGSTVLQSNASLGITKLALLAQAPADVRPELLEDQKIAGMSVREVKAMVEKCRQQGEQLSLLQNQPKSGNASDDLKAEQEKRSQTENKLAAAGQKIEELKRQLEDATDTVDLEADLAREEDRRKEAEDQLEKIKEQIAGMKKAEPDTEQIERLKKDAEKEAREKLREEIRKKTEKAKADALKEAEKKIATARAEGEKSGKQAAAEELRPLKEEKERLEGKARELQKKLQVAGNKETVLFAHLFEELQGNFERMTELLGKMEPDARKKFGAALLKYIGIMEKQLNGKA